MDLGLDPGLATQAVIAALWALVLALVHADDPRTREALRLWVAGEVALLASRLVLVVVAVGARHAPEGAGAAPAATWAGMLPGVLSDGLDAGLVLATLAWRGLALSALAQPSATGRRAVAWRLLPLAAIGLAVAAAAVAGLALRRGSLWPAALAVASAGTAALAWRLRSRDGPTAVVMAAAHVALAGHAIGLAWRLAGGQDGASLATAGPRATLPTAGDAWFESGALAVASVAWLRLLQNRLRLRLTRQRATDALTGALNRPNAVAALERALARSSADDSPLCIALLDVEDFGELNDAQGLAVGDRLITVVARSCLRSLRAGDAVGRWGGGQLLLVMPDVGQDDATNVLDRLRRQIDEALARAGLPAVTLSVGLWERPPRTTDIGVDQALKAATRQLLRARRLPERQGLRRQAANG